MTYFAWNAEKNEKLKLDRGVTFEEAVFHIENGNVLDIIDHSNPTKYKNQRIYVVAIEGYAYLVPFVTREQEIFLKTIMPSRKMTRRYLYDEKDD